MRGVRAALVALCASSALFVAACGDGPPSSSGPAAAGPPIGAIDTSGKADVTVQQVAPQKFNPATATSKVGQVVEWKNADQVTHNVTFKGHDDLSSPSMDAGKTHAVKFTVAGKYDYSCTIHPGMDGTITVT